MDASRRRRLNVEDIGDVTVVNFVDRKILDEQNIQIIGEQLFNLVDELNRKKIVLSFHNVEYFSASGLGKLLTLHSKLSKIGGQLVFCSMISEIFETFEITKLYKLFTIVKDEQRALQAFV